MKKKGSRKPRKYSCNPGTWLGCIVADQIKQSDQGDRIKELKRQRQELKAQLDAMSAHSPTPHTRTRGRQMLSVRNNARRKNTHTHSSNSNSHLDDSKGGSTGRKREILSVGGSMDESHKLQGHIDLLREQQKIQQQSHDHQLNLKDDQIKAKELEIQHLRERLEQQQQQHQALKDKTRLNEHHSDQMESIRARVVFLEKKLSEKEQKIRQLDTNPHKFMQLQRYVHEELTRYVERIMRSLEDCTKTQKEAYAIIAELRKAIGIEIANKIEVLGKKLGDAQDENDAWSSRISMQNEQMHALKKEVMMLRKQSNKILMAFEAYKQQKSLQMLQLPNNNNGTTITTNPNSQSTSVATSVASPKLNGHSTSNGNGIDSNGSAYDHKIDAMRSDIARIDAAAIVRQEQVDGIIENNKFLKKELDRRSRESDVSVSELVSVSRKNSNANSYVNDAQRRLDDTRARLSDQIEPSAMRANQLVSSLVEKMSTSNGEFNENLLPSGLSRSTPGEDQTGSWYDVIKGIKFTWD
mmetsp:Transcript_15104/g.27199  ORF Transcript_15104/g.27199 Transcript_15104/m.27199 type:complete len:524 (-) Transcript_15104:291-1862(-)|eukprot:CAMPEP_0197527786 /NCGR_PEP_ID=MMETSP1318-20131121/22776_1 /TAXON_ID=552666 /ORGANISM="Partenskyella glossopodia, Strain RCC365" /LENGTH=523 /DNA_ID=CAMNT_0043082589 /DNA_START=93 /DNA_END=1664 /DNA_ORIENTATION=-